MFVKVVTKIIVTTLIRNRKLASKIKYVMDNKIGWERSNKRFKGIMRRGYKRN